MAYTAIHKFARISPRKVRALADLVRGKFADEALDILPGRLEADGVDIHPHPIAPLFICSLRSQTAFPGFRT